MAPTKIDLGTIIILDIGRNVSMPEEKNGQSFFEKGKECAGRIIERKIISQGKNLLGIILLGAKTTNNTLAEQAPGTCRNIQLLTDLQYPTWSMIRNLPDVPSKSKGNWFDALLVAAEHLKNGVPATKIVQKKIILMTNFLVPCDTEDKQIKQAIAGFQEEGFEVDIIGPDIYSEENDNNDVELARLFVEETKGATATFDYTMRYLLFHKKKATNAIPWNVDLSIGPNIKIPVSAYIRIKDEPVIKKWNTAIRNPVTNTASSSEGIKKEKVHINAEDQTTVAADNIIKGYEYGQQIIPFSDCDKSMLYDPGQKSLKVYGFTKSSNITWQNLNGDGLSYVFAQKRNKKAQYALRCLVECLLELDLVGIVRRVYNNGNAPKMYALMPVIDTNNFVCLSMVGFCYKDEIKNMAFPVTNIKKYACNNEQVECFKELIKAMDLTTAYEESEFDDTEAFPIAKMVSPSAQYILDCIAYRAMNPGKPLPQPRDDIVMLFKIPPLIEKRSREVTEKLKKLFVLNKVEIKKRDKKKNHSMDMDDYQNQSSTSNADVTMGDLPKIDLKTLKRPDSIQRIGTMHPINDYDILKQGGKTVSDLATQMTEAIESMIHGNLDGNFSKALDAMMHFRNECLKTEPKLYNDWLKNFQTELTNRKRNNVIETLNEKKLNYILQSENSLSTVKSYSCDDSQLYENDTEPMLTEVNISSEVNDLFDNM
ncbi:X-ray repair cross-complementing protein 5-like [Pararge aegeria]|uniref:X-ray repair cross-complementing protein 5-like n=1 Tax=Pararge aegeria TaxID=116150 RepID=UPI0019D00133|nr:X-ray repair cross-complementing protein 5-like [Pararge aegeria]